MFSTRERFKWIMQITKVICHLQKISHTSKGVEKFTHILWNCEFGKRIAKKKHSLCQFVLANLYYFLTESFRLILQIYWITKIPEIEILILWIYMKSILVIVLTEI